MLKTDSRTSLRCQTSERPATVVIFGIGGGVGWGGIYNNVIGTATHVRDATLLYALFDFIHIHTNIMLALPHIRHATLL